ncbi:chemotaxis protein CheB [Streptosporangium sp. NBC_01469]|uniref:chemotaxis protein CheB n=1 Tax=Streptosporangium sp. NBC_01469 TaxID=2903898 RepID=UPI003FCDC498
MVVAASAGGVEALSVLPARMPGDLATSVPVVPHLPPRGESSLARNPRPCRAAGGRHRKRTMRMPQSRIDGTEEALALT